MTARFCMHISGVNKAYEVGPLEDSTGNIISQGFLMAKVPDAKFQEAKSDYLEQLIVTPERRAKKIKQ